MVGSISLSWSSGFNVFLVLGLHSQSAVIITTDKISHADINVDIKLP